MGDPIDRLKICAPVEKQIFQSMARKYNIALMDIFFILCKEQFTELTVLMQAPEGSARCLLKLKQMCQKNVHSLYFYVNMS